MDQSAQNLTIKRLFFIKNRYYILIESQLNLLSLAVGLSDCPTTGLSDYLTVGLSGCRIIGLTPYKVCLEELHCKCHRFYIYCVNTLTIMF